MVEWIYKFTDISSIKRISFRQDINGLRAIAVLAVVFYHADLELFKGGWLGVDIFFVISGYLISNIIISELNDGTFSLKTFYLRRMRRILPALFSTLLLTIPFAYYFLTPKAMEEYIDSLIASVFFYANYHFMNLDFYVAEATKFMPLLHTWSLAIEEQYYLLFPLFAFIVYKYFKKYFTFFIGLITLGSMYLNTLSQSSDKFYRLEFRIWELLLGVLVMILSNNLKIKHLEKIGLPLMLIPIFYFDDNWINESEPKIITLIGISIIIFSNSQSSILTKLLSGKIISLIGLSSYSIYLLHQPLFSFARLYKLSNWNNFLNNTTDLDIPELIFLILLLVILGFIFYNTIEKNFLLNRIKLINLIWFLLLIPSLSFFSSQINSFIFSSRNVPIEILNWDIKSKRVFLNEKNCLITEKNFLELINDPCYFDNNSDLEVYIIGDSQMNNFQTLYDASNDYNITHLAITGCIFQFNIKFRENDCGGVNSNSYSDIVENIYNSVIIYGGRFPLYLSEEMFFNGYIQEPGEYGTSNNYTIEQKKKSFLNTINLFVERGNIVILIYPIPEQGWNVYDIYANGLKKWNENLGYPHAIFKERVAMTYEILDSALHPNIYRVYPESIFCDTFIEKQCAGKYKDLLFYQDDDHLSIEGQKLVSNEIIKILKIINIKNK